MPQVTYTQTRLALDPIAFFVLLVIVVNIVASISKALKRAAANVSSARTVITSDQGRAAQSMSPAASAARNVAASRAAELERLRQALLAAAQTPAQTPVAQKVVQAVQTVAQAPIYKVASSPIPASTAQQVVQTVSDLAAAALPTEWTLAPGGALMTLESGETAFNSLDAPGSTAPQTAPAAPTAPAFDIAPTLNNGAALFIAAAVVGPCAAFRTSGHTPGGW